MGGPIITIRMGIAYASIHAVGIPIMGRYARRESQEMSRKHNTKHSRNQTSYALERKGHRADRYGRFDNGRQISPDNIAGRSIWYPVKKEEKENV